VSIVRRLDDRRNRSAALLSGRNHEQRMDYCLAACIALALEVAVFSGDNLRGPLTQDALAGAVLALAAIWRRRSPLIFLVVVGIAALSLSRGSNMTSTNYATLADLYCVVFPTYTVAAWEQRNRAVVGFLLWIAFAIAIVAAQHLSRAVLVPATVTALVAWVAGRVMHSQRSLEVELQCQLNQLTTERADRACLAVAGERMRIARELDEVVAHSVAAMVVEAEAAERLLDEEASKIDVALATVENTGRAALIEMRRILGALRRPEDTRDLEPQPGVGQIHALVQRNRGRGQLVT
jgi:signal transduction histidine kinase